MGIAAAPRVVFDPFVVQRGELGPLFGREDLAHVKQHQRAHLVQLGSRRFDEIDLPGDLRLVDILVDKTRQVGLFAVQLRATFAKFGKCGLKNGIDAGALVAGESEVLLELLGFPPRKR